MTSWESAKHRNVVLSQQLVEHGFNTYDLAVLVCELRAAADELAENDSLATVEHAVHLQQAHLAVDVTHILTDFFHEKNQVFGLGGISPRADVGREGAEIAANEHATGLAQNVLLMCRNFIAGRMLITPARLQNP